MLATAFIGLAPFFAGAIIAMGQTSGSPTSTGSSDSRSEITHGSTIEQQMINRVLETPVGGNRSAADLNLEDDLVRRTADRALRAMYQERFHVVVRDEDFVSPFEIVPTRSGDDQPATKPSPTGRIPTTPVPPHGTSSYFHRWGPVILLGGPALFVLWLTARRIVRRDRNDGTSNRLD